MFRKSFVLACGGYPDEPLYEDYALWVRILLRGGKCDNLQDVLVDMRANVDLYTRRGGWKYAKNEISIQFKFYKSGFLGFWNFIANIILRVPVRCGPRWLRQLLYVNLLRS